MKKKRILALLLAGLMTASMTSCIARGNGNDDGSGTEQYTVTTEVGEENYQYIDVDEYVYVLTDNLTLISVNDKTVTVKAPKMARLHRVKFNEKQSVVVYEDAQYYAASGFLSSDDLTGEYFTTCEPKTMYSKESANIRAYASSDDSVSRIIKTLKKNDTVTVVAVGEKWSKIRYMEGTETKYYFVFSNLLTDAPETDYDAVDYSDKFTDCTPVTMYVISDALTLRKNSHAESSVLGYLKKNDEVTVVATGTVNGSNWAKLKVLMSIKEGDPQEEVTCFVNSKFLSTTREGGNLTLEDMLNEYKTFKAVDTAQTLYATGSVYVRTSPRYTDSKDKDNNIKEGATLAKGTKVTVVAYGKADDINWAMIKWTDNTYCFVSSAYLTSDPSGAVAALSLDEMLQRYNEFSKCTEQDMVTKGKANCYIEPKSGDVVSKELAAGTKVTIMATSEADATWCIIRTTEGAYYFVGRSLLEAAPQAD